MDVDDTGFGALWLEHRPFLIDLAFKILGNFSDAEDVVQDSFSRLLRADLAAINDVRGWLIVVVTRRCLDDLRSARARRVTVGADWDSFEPPLATDPADRVTLDDSIRMALVVMLQQLSPAERTVFVLHDVFGYPFDSVAAIVGRTVPACRKLASRARRRIEEGTGDSRFMVGPLDEHRIIERFIAACAGGDLERLVELLDPDVVGVVDIGTTATRPPLVGRDIVAPNVLRFFGPRSGVTLVSHPVNGSLGVLAFRDRGLVALATFGTRGPSIVDIHSIADPRKLALASLQFSTR